MLSDVSYNTGPVVNGTGYFSLSFKKFHKIVVASKPTTDDSVNLTGDISAGIDLSWSWGSGNPLDNSVNIYPFVRSDALGRRAAVTADLVGKKFVCVAYGE